MPQPFRLPLVEAIEPRESGEAKDGLASNVFYDKQQNGTIYAVKRPGVLLFNSGLGQPSGLYSYRGTLYDFNYPNLIWTSPVWNGSYFVASSLFYVASPSVPLSAKSSDGINWTFGTMPNSLIYSAPAWNGSVWCCVANDPNTGSTAFGATSSDGISWTQRTLPSSGNWEAVDWNGSRFVAIRDTGQSAFSTDGISWSAGGTASTTGGIRSLSWNAGAGLFCAVEEVTASTKVYTSTNGVSWTTRTIGAGSRATIASNGTIWFTPNLNSNKGYTSADGITWTERTLPSSRGWNTCAWTGSHFVVMNGNATIQYVAYSTDGINWQEVQVNNSNDFLENIGGNTDIILALGSGNEYKYSQDDGQSYRGGNLNFQPA